ncbi:MAG: CPXCG motif-containing cysteine-rich protein [Wenzhouxiangellaceae bacterium]|nr:CPXCG motif-containing cysteine-rich protein [Wenzhouxiangellaceae bacterium]
MLTDSATFSCPWCGEPNDVGLEPGDAGAVLVQDCGVCCRPIELRMPDRPGEAPAVRREGE